MKDLEQGEFIRHDACTNCGSSDALAVYTNNTYCFVCHEYTSLTTNKKEFRKPMSQYIGEAVRLNKRNISQALCEKYKIYRDGSNLRFFYHNLDGLVVGSKVRKPDKSFTYDGVTEGTFFGQHLYPSSGKRVVITEGELDAVSCSEAMPSWPMVSLPNGAAGAKKSIQKNLEWLQGYESIVLFFDNDEVGIRAAKEAANVLPPGKVKIATIQGYKDANEALMDNNTEAINRAIWDAKPYRPDGIVEARSLLNDIITPQAQYDHEYPYEGLNDKLNGIRYGSLITITAGSGIGKSSVCRDLANHLLNRGEKVGYIALEESNRQTAMGLMSSALHKNYTLGEYTTEELQDAYDQTLANWDLYLYDGFGSFDPDVIYNRIEYLSAGLDCKVVFLDHLSILLSGLDGDERRMIDTTMTRLRSLVERTGITLFLVSHLRRSHHDSGHEEGARVSLSQLRGSASIAQLSDAVIGLERDQQSGQAGATTTVRVLKNRHSGQTGVACYLDYDLENCKFTESNVPEEFDPTTDF